MKMRNCELRKGLTQFKNAILALIFTVLQSSCTNTTTQNSTSSNNINNDSIIGIWAMIPLSNGIANVVEFSENGISTLYSYNCNKESSEETEISKYRILDDGNTINIQSKNNETNIKIKYLRQNSMELAYNTNGFGLAFKYIRSKKISPLCFLYTKKEVVQSKNTPFIKDDFISNPYIPDSPNINRYLGKWADKKGAIQIEAIQDKYGRAKINHESSENWHYLYNNVSWSGNELHFQSFAYSEKNELFDHPYHKSKDRAILTPVGDSTKIKYSFFIKDSRYDYILRR